MKYVVIDLEFNQPYDFKEGAATTLVSECRFEIIQIGAVIMDSDFNILDSRSFLVKPQIYTRIHPIVEKMTGLTSEKLKFEKSFPEIYDDFIEYINEEYVFCVWGASDIKILHRNINYYNLDDTKLTKSYLNVQQIASLHLKRPMGVAIGLRHAVESFNIEMDNYFHNALYDAIYTAKILKKLRNDNFQILTFELNPLKKMPIYKTDVQYLYSIIEKDLGRKLNKKEKVIFKKVYEMGISRKCEF